MATAVLETIGPAAPRAFSFRMRLAALVVLGLLLAALFPAGYVGGGADDGRYLEAVRCVVSQGYCIPANHWAARLPLVLPASAAVWLLGESRATLMLVPLLYAIGSLVLFALLVRRTAGERASLIGSLALLGTPIFVARWPRLNVDIPELFFLLGAVSLLVAAVRRDRARLAVLSGAAVGLAVLSRTTAIVVAPILVAGLILFTPRPARWTLLLALGGTFVLAAEAALHALTAGRPLLSWELAHAHTRIPTSALPRTVDLSRSPILNLDYIANWQRPAGIHVHWLVDGVLNLLADPVISLTLWASLLLAAAAWMEARRKRARPGRLGLFLTAGAAAHFCALTYILAVHPTARMFMPLACVGAFAIGSWGDSHRARAERALTGAILSTMIALTAIIGIRSAHLSAYQAEAERWVRTNREPLAISRTGASAFALSPLLSRLPHGAAAGRPMIGITPGCGVEPSRLLRRFVHKPDWPIPYALARRLGLTGRPVTLCLISPAGREPSPRA